MYFVWDWKQLNVGKVDGKYLQIHSLRSLGFFIVALADVGCMMYQFLITQVETN